MAENVFFEPRDLPARKLIKLALILIGVLVLIGVVLLILQNNFLPPNFKTLKTPKQVTYPNPQVSFESGDMVRQLNARQFQDLNSFGRLPNDSAHVHVPIARAKSFVTTLKTFDPAKLGLTTEAQARDGARAQASYQKGGAR